MSYIEQTRDWTEQERLEWIKAYPGIAVETPNSWVPEYAIDYKKKCCDNCALFSPMDERDEDGFCMKNVTNDLSGQGIIHSDTFYCSYYRFINSLGSYNE